MKKREGENKEKSTNDFGAVGVFWGIVLSIPIWVLLGWVVYKII